MGMDGLEKAITDLEQRMALLEEVVALTLYREQEAKQDDRREFNLRLDTKGCMTGLGLKGAE